MLDAVGNHFDGQPLSVADGLFAGLAVGHHAREFQRFGDPAPIVFPVQFDGNVHIAIVQQAVVLGFRERREMLRAGSRLWAHAGAELPGKAAHCWCHGCVPAIGR